MYEDGDIRIDSHFAHFGARSYAIAKIYSVYVKDDKKSGVVWMLAALATLIAGIGALGASATTGFGEASSDWLTFLFIAAVAVALYRGRPLPTYQLMLVTSSGEQKAIESADREKVAEVSGALEKAMACQG